MGRILIGIRHFQMVAANMDQQALLTSVAQCAVLLSADDKKVEAKTIIAMLKSIDIPVNEPLIDAFCDSNVDYSALIKSMSSAEIAVPAAQANAESTKADAAPGGEAEVNDEESEEEDQSELDIDF